MNLSSLVTKEPKQFGATDTLMIMAIFFWGINFSIVKIALQEFDPLGFNGFRMVIASLFLIIIQLIRGENFFIEKTDIGKIVLLGLIGNTIFQLLFINGLNLSKASNISVVMAMIPLFVAILSSLLKIEKIHWAAWMGIIISLVGFYFVIAEQGSIIHTSWKNIKGDMIVLFGNLFWAVYTVLSKPFLEKMSPIKFTSLTMAIGTVFYLPFCINSFIKIQYSKISITAWIALLYSGLFALGICYIIWYVSVHRVGTTKTAIYNNFVPILAILTAVIVLGECFTLLQMLGTFIVLLGVYLTRSGYHFFKADKRL